MSAMGFTVGIYNSTKYGSLMYERMTKYHLSQNCILTVRLMCPTIVEVNFVYTL